MTILNETKLYSPHIQWPDSSTALASRSCISFFTCILHFKQRSEYRPICTTIIAAWTSQEGKGMASTKQINPMVSEHSPFSGGIGHLHSVILGVWFCTSKHYFEQHLRISMLTWLQRTVISIILLILKLLPSGWRQASSGSPLDTLSSSWSTSESIPFSSYSNKEVFFILFCFAFWPKTSIY